MELRNLSKKKSFCDKIRYAFKLDLEICKKIKLSFLAERESTLLNGVYKFVKTKRSLLAGKICAI